MGGRGTAGLSSVAASCWLGVSSLPIEDHRTLTLLSLVEAGYLLDGQGGVFTWNWLEPLLHDHLKLDGL